MYAATYVVLPNQMQPERTVVYAESTAISIPAGETMTGRFELSLQVSMPPPGCGLGNRLLHPAHRAMLLQAAMQHSGSSCEMLSATLSIDCLQKICPCT